MRKSTVMIPIASKAISRRQGTGSRTAKQVSSRPKDKKASRAKKPIPRRQARKKVKRVVANRGSLKTASNQEVSRRASSRAASKMLASNRLASDRQEARKLASGSAGSDWEIKSGPAVSIANQS